MGRFAHRPALTGLRAVAIVPVVALHATGRPAGGYLGVDLFFCLSGFLITHLLLDEHAATGRISLRAFYERRARRLLPALFVLLAVYATVMLARGDRPLAPVLEGLFYCTNITYGFSATAPTPLTPLWSLAAEEQFYLVWPVLLIFLLRRRPAWIGRVLVALLVVVVAHRTAMVVAGAPERLYFRPYARCDGLIVGCLFGLWHHQGTHRALITATSRRTLAYLFIPVVICFLLVPPDSPLLVAALPLSVWFFGALIYLAAGDGSVSRVLAWRPLVYLGGISYALYLWNLPLVWATHWVATGALGAALALVAADLSTRFVERPFRRRPARPDRTGDGLGYALARRSTITFRSR